MQIFSQNMSFGPRHGICLSHQGAPLIINYLQMIKIENSSRTSPDMIRSRNSVVCSIHSRLLYPIVRSVACNADSPLKILAVSSSPFCFAVGMRAACVNKAVLRIVLRLVCGSGGG